MGESLRKLNEVPAHIRIGWVGTGVMGESMCGHLLVKGYQVTVHSRTKAKAASLVQAGATWRETPSDVASNADVTVTMVGFPQEVREVYFGRHGVLAGAKPGAVLVDMTSTEPRLAREIAAAAEAQGAHAVDAPVSGGDVGAKAASLSIMAGGEPQVVRALMPIFEVMGKKIVDQGPAGFGQHTKLCNQIVIAGTMIGVCESLLYGHRAGLDLKKTLESVSGGAASCWTLDNLAPRILQRNFDPGFFVEHFIKDMGIALDEAKRMGIVLPGLALVHQLYLSVQAHGHGKAGTHALMLALEELSNAPPCSAT